MSTTPSDVGQINAAGDVDALFLKQFAGEVLTAFEQKVMMNKIIFTRTISSGRQLARYLVNCGELPLGQSAAKPGIALGKVQRLAIAA